MRKNISFRHSKPSVLLIDNETLDLKSVVHQLIDDYEVQWLPHPLKAMHALPLLNRQPDIIVASLSEQSRAQNDDMSQLQALAVSKDIPMIFATATLGFECFDLSTNLKVTDFIIKPFKPAELKIRLRNQLLSMQAQIEAHKQKLTDPITGIANKYHFSKSLPKVWEVCLKETSPLALVLIDIDHFKHFNQCHGLNYGDLVLQMIAEDLQNLQLEPNDLVCTMQGNQFALLKPGCSLKEIELIARNVLKRIASLQIINAPICESYFLTVSIGVCLMMPEKSLSSAILIEEADLSLFKAKNMGRNRVEVHHHLPSQTHEPLELLEA